MITHLKQIPHCVLPIWLLKKAIQHGYVNEGARISGFDVKIVASLTGIGSQRASVWQEGGKSAGVKDTARWDLWEKDREKALCS